MPLQRTLPTLSVAERAEVTTCDVCTSSVVETIRTSRRQGTLPRRTAKTGPFHFFGLCPRLSYFRTETKPNLFSTLFHTLHEKIQSSMRSWAPRPPSEIPTAFPSLSKAIVTDYHHPALPSHCCSNEASGKPGQQTVQLEETEKIQTEPNPAVAAASASVPNQSPVRIAAKHKPKHKPKPKPMPTETNKPTNHQPKQPPSVLHKYSPYIYINLLINSVQSVESYSTVTTSSGRELKNMSKSDILASMPQPLQPPNVDTKQVHCIL